MQMDKLFFDGFFYFISNISEMFPVSVCWVLCGICWKWSLLCYRWLHFVSSTQGDGGLVNFVHTNGVCLLIAVKISFFRVFKWSSVWSEEYIHLLIVMFKSH